LPECVFDNANRTQTIHNYDIKPNIRKLPIGHLGQIFFCAGIQTFHLARAYTPCSAVKIAALLHFDNHQTITILHDQINFLTLAAPTDLSY